MRFLNKAQYNWIMLQSSIGWKDTNEMKTSRYVLLLHWHIRQPFVSLEYPAGHDWVQNDIGRHILFTFDREAGEFPVTKKIW